MRTTRAPSRAKAPPADDPRVERDAGGRRPRPRRPPRRADPARLAALAAPRRRRTRKSLIDLLPVQHVVFEVLAFLDERDVLATAVCCSELLRIASADPVWRRLWQRRSCQPVPVAAGTVKHAMLRKRHAAVAGRRSRLQAAVSRAAARGGRAEGLAAAVAALEPELSVAVNGQTCALLGFRRRAQQSRREAFRVHAAAAAPNLAEGALRFELSSAIKIAVPPGLRMDAVREVVVSCRCAKPRPSRVARPVLRATMVPAKATRLSGAKTAQRFEAHAAGVGSSVLLGTLEDGQADASVALLVVNLHHADLLAGLGLRGFGRGHVPVPDDLDSRYGLRGYTCSVTLRSLGTAWWSAAFRDVDAELARPAAGAGPDVVRLELLRAETCCADVTRRVEGRGAEGGRPQLYFRTDAFTGFVADAAVLDFALWDEHGEVFWAFSRAVPARAPAREAGGFQFGGGGGGERAFELKAGDEGVGSFRLEVCEMDEAEALVVKACTVELQASRVAQWFATAPASSPTPSSR